MDGKDARRRWTMRESDERRSEGFDGAHYGAPTVSLTIVRTTSACSCAERDRSSPSDGRTRARKWHSAALHGTQMARDAPGGTQRHPDSTSMAPKWYAMAPTGTQWHPVAPTSTQMHPEAPSGPPWRSHLWREISE